MAEEKEQLKTAMLMSYLKKHVWSVRRGTSSFLTRVTNSSAPRETHILLREQSSCFSDWHPTTIWIRRGQRWGQKSLPEESRHLRRLKHLTPTPTPPLPDLPFIFPCRSYPISLPTGPTAPTPAILMRGAWWKANTNTALTSQGNCTLIAVLFFTE